MDCPRILAIDDEPNQLAALKRMLRRSQFTVDISSSGRAGLRMIVQNPPDLILLDVSMPGMSGHEFLRRLRRLETRGRIRAADGFQPGPARQIPVIFLTALDAPHQRVSGLDAGAVDYITKPFNADELRARIRNQLRRAQQQREMLAASKSKVTQLESAVGRILEVSSTLQEALSHLDICLVQAAYTDDADRRRELVVKAKNDIQQLEQSLSSIAESFEAKRV